MKNLLGLLAPKYFFLDYLAFQAYILGKPNSLKKYLGASKPKCLIRPSIIIILFDQRYKESDIENT